MSAKFKDFIYRYHNILLFLVYATISLAIMTYHEPFKDELNVWGVLQNVPLKDLPFHTTHDGHPIIYFLFWYPFVKIGLPFIFCRVITWLACAAAVALLCLYAPFSFPVKTMITFSAPMIYWYPSVARNYSFLPLIVFLLAYLSTKIKDRTDKKYGIYIILFCIAAGLAPNIHLVYGMLGGSIFILLAYMKIKSREKFSRNEIIASTLFLLLLAVPATQTFIAYTRVTPEYVENTKLTALDVIENISRNLACNWKAWDIIAHDNQWLNYYVEDVFTGLTLLLFLSISFILLRLSPCIFFIFAASSLYHFSVYLAKYPIFLPYRIYTFETVLIACVWAAALARPDKYTKHKKTIEALIAIMLIPAIVSGMEMCYFEIKEPFTPDIAMAEYIDRNIPEGENTKIYMTDSSAFTGTKFYSKKHEFYDKDNKPIKYITVYLKRKIYSIPKVHKGKEIYIIDHSKTEDDSIGIIKDKSRTKKIFCSYKGIVGPQMCLYKVIDK